VLGHLGRNFDNPQTLNIVPLLVPKTPIQNGQMHFLQDLQAVTSATIFDPIRRPLNTGKKSDVGFQLDYFEMQRYRSNIVGVGDENLLLEQVEELRAAVDQGSYESELELGIIKERLGKLTGGIAKLTVVGASNGEIREKKDRAEDAACAVRGAIKHGCLPGGTWTFAKLTEDLWMEYQYIDNEKRSLEQVVVQEVLIPALGAPFEKLLSNCGFSLEEIEDTAATLIDHLGESEPYVFDALEQKFIKAKESGVMDSTPAVLEALRNSISIAALLGTLGGAVVFPRDNELERQEASDTYDFLRSAEGGGES
jgi:chaperonin GroEL